MDNTSIQNLCKKLKIKNIAISAALDVLSGKTSLKDGQKAMNVMRKTDVNHLTIDGVKLRRFIIDCSSFYHDKVQKGKPH